MSGPSYTGVVDGGLEVTVKIDGAHDLHPTYPLLPGDLLFKRPDGRFDKFGPGLGICGFVLTAEQEATLRPTGQRGYGIGGMDFFLGSDA